MLVLLVLVLVLRLLLRLLDPVCDQPSVCPLTAKLLELLLLLPHRHHRFLLLQLSQLLLHLLLPFLLSPHLLLLPSLPLLALALLMMLLLLQRNWHRARRRSMAADWDERC